MSVCSCRFFDGLDPTVEYDVLDDIDVIAPEKFVQRSQADLIEHLVVKTFEFRLRDRYILKLLTVGDVLDLFFVGYRFLRGQLEIDHQHSVRRIE